MGSFYEAHVVIEVSKRDINEAQRKWEERNREKIKSQEEKDKRERETLEDIAGRLVDELAGNLKTALHNTSTPIPVTIGNFTYGNTGCSGEFMEGFKDLIEGKATINKYFKTTGRLKIYDMAGNPNLDPDRETDQAKIMATNILHGKYTDDKHSVIVTAFLTDKNSRISSATVHINKEKINKEISAKGCKRNTDIISAAGTLSDPDFNIDLWLDKGNGGVYKSGERISLMLRTDIDCYIKVLYIDASGNRILMYPTARDTKTKLRKGIIYNLHQNNDYEVTGPFGSEMIMAFASTLPFSDKGEIEVGGGFRGFDPNKTTPEIVINLRGIKVGGKKTLKSEARVYLTTVK